MLTCVKQILAMVLYRGCGWLSVAISSGKKVRKAGSFFLVEICQSSVSGACESFGSEICFRLYATIDRQIHTLESFQKSSISLKHTYTSTHIPSNSYTVTGTRSIIQPLIIFIPGYITEVALISGGKKRLVRRTYQGKKRAFVGVSSGCSVDATFLEHLKQLEEHFTEALLRVEKIILKKYTKKKKKMYSQWSAHPAVLILISPHYMDASWWWVHLSTYK